MVRNHFAGTQSARKGIARSNSRDEDRTHFAHQLEPVLRKHVLRTSITAISLVLDLVMQAAQLCVCAQ